MTQEEVEEKEGKSGILDKEEGREAATLAGVGRSE